MLLLIVNVCVYCPCGVRDAADRYLIILRNQNTLLYNVNYFFLCSENLEKNSQISGQGLMECAVHVRLHAFYFIFWPCKER